MESLAPRLSCPAKAGHPVITDNLVVTGPAAFAGVTTEKPARTLFLLHSQCFPRRPPYPLLETQEIPPHQNCPQNPLDSCNENLPEKRIHRKYASRPGGRPRRVFCCADASRGRARRIFVRHQKGISHAVSAG